jgi:hypothetical protein
VTVTVTKNDVTPSIADRNNLASVTQRSFDNEVKDVTLSTSTSDDLQQTNCCQLDNVTVKCEEPASKPLIDVNNDTFFAGKDSSIAVMYHEEGRLVMDTGGSKLSDTPEDQKPPVIELTANNEFDADVTDGTDNSIVCKAEVDSISPVNEDVSHPVVNQIQGDSHWPAECEERLLVDNIHDAEVTPVPNRILLESCSPFSVVNEADSSANLDFDSSATASANSTMMQQECEVLEAVDTSQDSAVMFAVVGLCRRMKMRKLLLMLLLQLV